MDNNVHTRRFKARPAGLFMAALLLTFTSCTSTSLKLSGVSMPLNEDFGVIIGEFNTTVHVIRYFAGPGGGFGYFGSKFGDNAEVLIAEAIKAETVYAGGGGAINVTVDWGGTWRDILLGVITGGIYSPATAKISGQVIK